MRFIPKALFAASLILFGGIAVGEHASAEGVSTVVASQGGVSVTLSDVDAFAQRIPEKDRPAFFNNPERIQTLISNLLLEKQLAAEARKNGLEKNDDVAARIDLAADEVLSNARMEEFKKDVKVPDLSELAHEEYIAHKEKYVLPGDIEVKHLLISTKTRSEEEAKTIADKVEVDAKAHPETFDALVEKYSDDPSKSSNHGLMSDAGSSRYDPAFAKAAKELTKPGQISPVVKTRFGFHVLKLVSRKPDKQQTFDQVKKQIVEQLRQNFVDKAIKTHTDEIRNRHIDANPDLVASLRSRYGTQPVPPETGAAGGGR